MTAEDLRMPEARAQKIPRQAWETHGASHQTGGTGLVAKLIQVVGADQQEQFLAQEYREVAAQVPSQGPPESSQPATRS